MRIVALVVLATLNYIIATLMAAIAFGITIVVAALLQGAFPRTLTTSSSSSSLS